MSALKHMVERLDNRQLGTSGYVTDVPELRAILAELSDLCPVGIHLSEAQYGDENVSVTIKFGFTIERRHI